MKIYVVMSLGLEDRDHSMLCMQNNSGNVSPEYCNYDSFGRNIVR